MTRACARALSDRLLLEWWAGEIPFRDRRRVEEHLLTCASCSARAQGLHALAEGVASLVRSGRIQAVVTSGVVEQMRAEGRKVREYRVRAFGGVQCTLAPDDEFLVARLQARIDAGTRVDILSRIDDGPELRIPDIPLTVDGTEIILAAPVDEIGARPVHVERLRLVAVEEAGDRVIGDYTFNHTPWPAP